MTLLILWTALIVLGLSRVIRLIVKDTWPPMYWLRMKLFLKFPPAGLVLDRPEEIAQITDDENGFMFFRGRATNKIDENGFMFFRGRATNKITEDTYQVVDGHWFGELFDCHYCLSFWATIPAVFFWYFAAGTIVAAPFAAASVPVFFTLLAAQAGFWGASSAIAGRM